MSHLPFTPESTRGETEIATGITDKKGYANRWQFSTRMVDNFLKAGLPHCKIGSRRVRIVVAEADKWMLDKYGTQRRGAANANRNGEQSR